MININCSIVSHLIFNNIRIIILFSMNEFVDFELRLEKPRMKNHLKGSWTFVTLICQLISRRRLNQLDSCFA